jgi:hypothetical protein
MTAFRVTNRYSPQNKNSRSERRQSSWYLPGYSNPRYPVYGHPAKGTMSLSTLIRHAGPGLTLSVGALAVSIVQVVLGALLVATVGYPSLLLPGFLTTALTAITLPAIARAANSEQRPTSRGSAKAMTENGWTAARHRVLPSASDSRG